MVYLIAFVATLWLPGYLVVRGLGLRGPVVLQSLAFSYVLAVLNVMAVLALEGRAGWFFALSAGQTALLLVLVGNKLRRRRRIFRRYRLTSATVGGLFVGFATIAYLVYAGPYTEVPADVWWHLGEIRDRLQALPGRSLESWMTNQDLLSRQIGYSYWIQAVLLFGTRSTLEGSIFWMFVTQVTAFVLAVYGFGVYLFRRERIGTGYKILIGVLGAVLFVVYFGTNIFSYVRYYALAPTLPAFILYLAAMVIVIQALVRRSIELGPAFLFSLLLGAMALVHVQEALFAVTGVVLMTGSWWALRWRRATHPWRYTWPSRLKPSSWLWLGVVLAGIAAYAYSLGFDYRSVPLEHGYLMELPYLDGFYVARPGHRFYETVSSWGLLVFGLFFWNWRRFRENHFLVAGMLVPAFTLFNPLFVDLFLKFSYPEVLWRFSFMAPLSFVGAYLLVHYGRRLFFEGRAVRKVAAALTLGLLVFFLTPIERWPGVSSFSRLATVRPVRADNDYGQWQDLFQFLRRYDDRLVLTDPVTGYTLKALTDNRAPGYKFREPHHYATVNWKDGRGGDFQDFQGWLVVVNQRDGGLSMNGRASGHWSVNVLLTSRFYSKAFLRVVDENPDSLELLWARDGIRVFAVRAKPAARARGQVVLPRASYPGPLEPVSLRAFSGGGNHDFG